MHNIQYGLPMITERHNGTSKKSRQQQRLALIDGSKIITEALVRSGADVFVGYPITPSNLFYKYAGKRFSKFFAAPDEITVLQWMSGFSAAGRLPVTATAFPGLALIDRNTQYGLHDGTAYGAHRHPAAGAQHRIGYHGSTGRSGISERHHFRRVSDTHFLPRQPRGLLESGKFKSANSNKIPHSCCTAYFQINDHDKPEF